MLGAMPLLLPSAAAEVQGGRPSSQAEVQVVNRLHSVLTAMSRSNHDDFYEAASLVIDASGDERDFWRLMSEAAEAGSPAACLWLARHLLPTRHKDATAAQRAAGLASRAADQGYVPAMVEYACLLKEGIGCAQDQKKAMAMLMDACKQGNQRARALYLAFTGRLSAGKEELPEVASELEKGNYFLEEMVAMQQTDPAEAERWLRRADLHGSAAAPFALSQMSFPGVKGQEPLECIRRAAERHHIQAMSLLGMVMLRPELVQQESGWQVKEDARAGLRLLLIATALGDDSVLGSMLAEGSLESDAPIAERVYALFRRNHLCGRDADTPGLGYCMVVGKGCPQDVEGGLKLLEEGRRKGTAQWVSQAMASLYFNGDGVKADMRKAIDCLGEDAAAGAVHAYAMMAALTALGNADAPPDLRTASFYLKMAEDAGDREAKQVYDSILKAGGWRFMPALFK